MATIVYDGVDKTVSIKKGEEQWFYVNFSSEGKANFYVNPNSTTLDVDLYVYSSNKTTLLGKATSGGVGEHDVIMEIPVESNKRYYIKVKAYGGSGTYLLRCKNYIQESKTKTLNLSYKAINQKFYGKNSTSAQKSKWGNFNLLEDNDPMYKAGCSRCSVACILSNIGGTEINPYDVPVVKDGTWIEGDFRVNFETIPSKRIISTSIVYELISSGGTTDNLAGVKSCIDSGYPAICKIGSGSATHFFVAYGYTNGAATTSDVLTYDTVYPKNYSNPDQQNTTLYGEDKTMKRVMELNGISKLTQVFTYKRA